MFGFFQSSSVNVVAGSATAVLMFYVVGHYLMHESIPAMMQLPPTLTMPRKQIK
jgi:hypothetical protein